MGFWLGYLGFGWIHQDYLDQVGFLGFLSGILDGSIRILGIWQDF